jgi:hypothetical protein
VTIDRPEQFYPPNEDVKQIFDSTFFSILKESSVEATLNKTTYEECIALNDSFDELGYGSICLKTLPSARHEVAMRIFPEYM